MSIRYTVIIEPFVERHYLKNFQKKYKGAWDISWRAVLEELRRFDALLSTSVAQVISEKGNVRIAKVEFRVAGTNESRKSSGNRCIVAVYRDVGVVKVLLVYRKNDLGDGGETARWKQIVRENYCL
jgi:hypothetical protein